MKQKQSKQMETTRVDLFTMLTYTIVLVFCLCGCTFASTGKSIAGTEFVFGFNSYRTYSNGRERFDNLDGHVYITTEAPMASVSVSYTVEPERSAKKTKTIYRYGSALFLIPSKLFSSNSGIYDAFIVKSTALVKVSALQRSKRGNAIDVFRVAPRDSCYKSYYVTTPIGYPFIMVFTFSEEADLKIKFPNFTIGFEEECSASESCAPGKTISVKLKPYKMWVLSSKDDKSDFQNTLITSNVPINVISGSFYCSVYQRSRDLCISSMKPTEAWGRQYFVPRFPKDDLAIALRVNAKSFPLDINIANASDSTGLKFEDHQQMHKCSNLVGNLFLKANVSFGLYLLTPSINSEAKWDASLLSLIPVEQWMNGVYLIPDIPLNEYEFKNYYLVSDMTEDKITTGKNVKGVSWTETVSGDKTKLYITPFELKSYTTSTSIFTREPGGKFMLYVTGAKVTYSFFAFPYDYRISSLYQEDCKKSTAVVGDGIDNDCDNKVDEEVQNGKDDDGDGSVDEDIGEDTSIKGTWARWFDSCTIPKCKEKTGEVKKSVRSCLLPSRFSEKCVGPRVRCSPGGSCDCAEAKTKWECDCSQRCDTCKNEKNGSATCMRCEKNYQHSPSCSIPCAKGWGGIGCSVIAVVNDPEDNVHVDDSSSVGAILASLLIVLALIGTTACCLYAVWKRRKQKEEEEEEQKAEETAKNQDTVEEERPVQENEKEDVGDEVSQRGTLTSQRSTFSDQRDTVTDQRGTISSQRGSVVSSERPSRASTNRGTTLTLTDE